MTYQQITYELADNVATITLNRPSSLNAFNEQMIFETIRALKDAGRSKEVRCIVLTGSGRAFSSGQDLKEFQDRIEELSLSEHIRTGYNQLIMQMAQTEKPIIAAVNGVAAGAGCGVTLAADIRIASDKASFILAFTRIGLVPDSGITWTLARLIGQTRAMEMALTGDPLSAGKALKWGLVNAVAPYEQFDEVVRAWARRLASGPTLAYGLAKRAMLRANQMSLEESLDYEARMQEITGRSRDFFEGVQAFLEKREAIFKGE